MGVLRFIHSIFHPVYASVRSHPLSISLLFGVKVPKGAIIHWDTTTLLLKNALRKVARKNDSVLEMGVGQAALLSICLQKKFISTMKIDGVDVSASRVESAQGIAYLNRCEMNIWQSDLFRNVRQRYDLIFFNPPYVPTAIGKSLELTRRLSTDGDQVWDGGESGTNVIQEFLASAGSHLQPSGRILLGVQDYYVKRKQIEEIASRHDYEIINVFTAWVNPSVVYLLVRKHPGTD